ncbi:Ribosome LSU-associated GTP-binding protein HflX [hydrothermal vent metagenome]|uniref:Ribosome LSU-associated GTP-binding protein HflX n=1 Tax=hydrothermal vent metagenome TaxID=652676 RepID=A0A3B0ZHA5_9ZZZZ
MFERPTGGERAVLVHLDINHSSDPANLEEFQELAMAAGAELAAVVTGSRRAPDAKYFAGTGKVDEILSFVSSEEAELVIFNHTLSPVQERNLEKALSCRVLDRTGLILDIFAQRARSHEGKLQVELAQLRHLSTRLVRGWTHLERQKGGIGLRGPGETQLESDRRLLADRIKLLKSRLRKVEKQREQGRRSRKRASLPTVSLVGYTNAGKSTLFNAITEADVYVADKLFATLDPTLRRIELEEKQAAVLADTVGFIRDLPHDLVAAFRSTLLETREADLLLHVIDAHDPQRKEHIIEVNAVLDEIEASDRPQLIIHNKIDLIDEAEPHIDRDDQGKPMRVWLSAQSGLGLDELRLAMTELLQEASIQESLELAPAQGKLHAKLHELGTVLFEETDNNGHWLMNVRMPVRIWRGLEKHFQLNQYISGQSISDELALGSKAP